MTRWATDDLTGRLLKSQSEPKADKLKLIEFPAILPNGKPVWPEYWNKEDLDSVKASISTKNWNAQYMQDPTSEEVLSSNVNGGTTMIKITSLNCYTSYKVMTLHLVQKSLRTIMQLQHGESFNLLKDMKII